MRKNYLKLFSALLVSVCLMFGSMAFAQESKHKVKADETKVKADGVKTKSDKDEHDHSKGGAVTNAVGTGVKQTGKSVGKGVGKAGKSVGKAASKVTEPVH